jgi:cobyrinic acid a,c-diamide synthase
VVVAGLAGDSGKTLVSLALLAAARERGLQVAAFKKGPDYIDAAWLSWAAGRPARNLDTFLAQPAVVAASFARHAVRDEPVGQASSLSFGRASSLSSGRPSSLSLNVIEGNRGLFDGLDAAGTHSTAALATLLDAPVLLVLNVRKMTGTAAALVKGCQVLDPRVPIAGVVLNNVAGRRHEAVLREAIEQSCGVKVVGAIPRLGDPDALPGRHLGLVPPAEHPGLERAAALVRRVGVECLDFEAIAQAAVAATAVEPDRGEAESRESKAGGRVPIGYLRDSAFSFYYPENLEALEARGARLVPISSFDHATLPHDLDALYIGGGFPETHAETLEANRTLLGAIREAAAAGLPIYAECGGLMLLARRVTWRGQGHEMAGVLGVDVEVLDAPQGHGYMVLQVDRPNAFFAPGLEFRAHEFHYSRVTSPLPQTACAVRRGTGCGAGRDALVTNNVWASYAHVHAAGLPEWADGMIAAARRHQAARIRS